MAMTTQTRPAETTTKEALPLEPPTGLGGTFGWIVVVLAVVAATVLGVRALGGDDPATPRPLYSVEHGSITAIDHAATPSAARQWYSVEQGSIAAVDHAAATAGSAAEVSAERGSITAIDHAATPSAARQWYSVEHGSITAIDHGTATAAER